METLLIVLIPGILGGLVLSVLIARNRRGTPAPFVSRPRDAPSPALINMAHIKVEGLGGLGLVAAVTAVAIADPRIRLAMIIALVLGGGLAFFLISMRRRTGAMPSSGEGPEDRSMLHLAADGRRTNLTSARATIDEVKRAGLAVA